MSTPSAATAAAVPTDTPGSQASLSLHRAAERPTVPRKLSSIGAKGVMAVTGAILTLFVIGHMLGNLQIYLGHEHLNAYAAKLQGMQEVVWLVRITLLSAFVAHIGIGTWLTLKNREARPVPYVYNATRKASLASRTMLWSGLVLLAFVIFHLAHYTLGWVQPDYFGYKDALNRHDVYRMEIEGFRVWWVSLAYIVSMLLLGWHLSHGIGSTFQSLGVNHPRWTPIINRVGFWLAMVLMIGNSSMPLAVMVGVVK
jgi:succinate dehydrogenase / fumarate reductase cytochrome b subunit